MVFRRKMIGALTVLATTVGVSATSTTLTGTAHLVAIDNDGFTMSSAESDFGGRDGADFSYRDGLFAPQKEGGRA
jgi:hypothetical protein